MRRRKVGKRAAPALAVTQQEFRILLRAIDEVSEPFRAGKIFGERSQEMLSPPRQGVVLPIGSEESW